MWKIILVATFVLGAAMDAEAVFGFDDYGYDPDFDFGLGFEHPNDFHNRLMAPIWPRRRSQSAIVSTIIKGDATATADASNLSNDIQDYNKFIQQPQAPFFDNIGLSDNLFAPNYAAAAASGSIGLNGGYQAAFISPENPDIPNISKHFASSSPNGFKGVFVSSFSSSSNINGKQTKHQHAQTTINDNGRITTYKVAS